MKKSLSAILSLAMAFSMFSSVALGADAKKSSADFSDLKDLDAATKAKFDEMIGAGIFEGDSTNGTFGLKNKMTRAQFAKVAALIFNLKVDSSLKTSSFSDVKHDDPANGFALPYIEAVKAAGITDGYAPGQFNPGGDVTKEQLAAFLLRGLGKDSEAKSKAGVSDKTVSDWAKGYVALALELKLLSNGTDGTFGGTTAATRDLLVTSSYEARKLFSESHKPAKASVKEVKAADYNKIQVSLDRDVDTDKATFLVKAGSKEYKYEAKDKDVKWSEDKKVATLTLKDGTKIQDGVTYNVTIGGLDEASVDKVSDEFKGEAERLTDIQFVSASETIARSKKVRVQIKPTNQYGQLASFSTGSYNYNITLPNNNAVLKRTDDKMFIEMTTDGENVYANSTVTINIWATDFNNVGSKTKTYKIGDYPFVSKVELGEVTYTNNKSAIQASGDKAIVKMTQYDQYGGEITVDSGPVNGNKLQDPYPYLTPKSSGQVWDAKVESEVKDDDGDGVKEIIVSANGKITGSGEYTLTVNGGGTAGTATIKVSASKVATKVVFGGWTNADGTELSSIAVGDKDLYLSFDAYDAQDNKLTVDEIVDNVKDGRFNINFNGPLTAAETADVPKSMLDDKKQVVITGANKGKIHVAEVTGKSSGQIYMYITNVAGNNSANKPFNTVDPRYPSSIKVVSAKENKAVAGAEVKPKYQLIDNYGDVLKEMGTKPVISGNGRTVTFDVYATVVRSDANATVVVDTGNGDEVIGSTVNGAGVALDVSKFSDKTIKIKVDENSAVNKTVEVRFAVRKKDGDTITEIHQIDKKVTVVDPKVEDLKYSLSPLGDLYKALDEGTYKEGASEDNKLAKEVKVIAKDSAGNEVAYPKRVYSVSTDVYSIAQPSEEITGDRKYKDFANKGYVVGNKTGTANVTAWFINAKGQEDRVTGPVTVKGDPIQITSIKAGKASKTFTANVFSDNSKHKAWYVMGDLTLTDNYGNEFKNASIAKYDKFNGVKYKISDATTLADGRPFVTIEGKDGIKFTNDSVKAGSFTIEAVTANGLTATTTVVINN